MIVDCSPLTVNFKENAGLQSVITGMNPKASREVLYPPLSGIVQLTNSDV